MDISCDIIRDLLPLYAENLVSEDSRKLVDEHLCTCDPCTKQLAILKKAAILPIEVETKSLKRVENIIQRKKILAVVTALMTALAVVVSGIVFMTTPVFLTAEQSIEGVKLQEDGGLAIDYASGITGRSSFALDEDITTRGIMCHTTRYDWLKSKHREQEWKGLSPDELETYILTRYREEKMTDQIWNRFHNISVDYGTWTTLDGTYLHVYDPEVWISGNGEWTHRESDVSQWYLDIRTGAAKKLLWSGNEKDELFTWIGPSYVYLVLFAAGAGIAVLAFLVSNKLSVWKKQLGVSIAIISGSIAFSVFLVTGGCFVIGEAWAYEWKEFIILESIFVTVAALLWHQLHLMNKQDRGM